MTNALTLAVGVTVGLAVGAILVPVTQRQLVAAMSRSIVGPRNTDFGFARWQKAALVVVSGLLSGVIGFRTGWTIKALPPLLLLLGLVQLACCDLVRFLLPKMLVHATTACVAIGILAAAALTGEWHRALLTAVYGLGFFLLFLAINLANPRWMAFGDVRLAPAIGIGLGWITPLALIQGFLLANVLTAVVGLLMICARRARRKSSLPFGLFLAIASGVVVVVWS